MASERRKPASMKKARRKGTFNIGTFLFGAVLIYLLTAVILYFTRSHIAPYEVTQGSISLDSVYTGVIVRNETEVTAPRGGYVCYYLEDQSKAGTGQPVCALTGKVLADRMAEETARKKKKKKLTAAQEAVMLASIQEYVTSYSSSRYTRLYDLHHEIDNAYGASSSDYLTGQLDELVKSGADIGFIEAPSDGLIVYTIDNLDGLRAEDVEAATFDQKKYKERVIRQGTKLEKDDQVFKIISDETWSILFPLSDKNAEKLGKMKQVETRIGNMQSTVWGDLSIVESSGDHFGQLTYHSDMLPFSGQRFVTVELILQNDTGLKIPRSSVTKRDMYEIPGEFVNVDPNTGSTGVQILDEAGNRTFTDLSIFCHVQKDKSDYYYVKPQVLEKGTIIGKDNSKKTFRVGKTAAMEGVYNINKGYASFQHIDTISSNKQYYIIEENSDYGPSVYDHIALNASRIEENRVVH